MPAYFNMSLVFERKDIYPDFTVDVHKLLHKSGLVFKKGFCEAEKDSLEDILSWNQKHLENNFELGFSEHYSHGYKQMLFYYGEFSYVRGFWMNNYPEDDEFTLEIIIPEEDILEYDGNGEYGYSYKQREVQVLKNSCKVLWNEPLVKTIQTGLEGSDATVSLQNIKEGVLPNIYPFAIVPYEFKKMFCKTKFCIEELDNRGILVQDMEVYG